MPGPSIKNSPVYPYITRPEVHSEVSPCVHLESSIYKMFPAKTSCSFPADDDHDTLIVTTTNGGE